MSRLRAYAGLWGLVAVVGATLVFLLSAAAPTVNRVQDTALRRTVAAAPYPVRDVVLSGPVEPPAPEVGGLLDAAHARLPQPLRGAVGAQWGAVRSGLVVLTGSPPVGGLPPKVTLLRHTGLPGGARLVSGAWPASTSGGLDVAVAEPVARALGLRPGGTYAVLSYFGTPQPVRVTGVFTLLDPASPAWAPYPTVNATAIVTEGPLGNPIERTTATLVTDGTGMSTLAADPNAWGLVDELRFRLDEHRLDADTVPALRTAVARTATLRPVPGLAVHTGLDGLLAGYARQAAAARALLAVVLAGIAGTALGLLALAARLAVDRRRGELSLLRARGASRPRLVGRLAAEAALVVGPAVALGWAGARAVPGRGGTGWLPAVAALVTLAAVPLAVGVARLPAFPDRVVRSRPGPVRRTVEVTVCVLAAAGVLLARRRGIAAVGVDPYLAAVPALAGIAVGLVALRAYPWPVRALGRVAARGTGAATFLGLARAGRAPVGSALPLVVLVLAVGMGGFAGSVRAGLAAARDEAAVRLVGGDLRVSAPAFAPGEVDRVAHVPGVTAVAAGYLAAPSALHAAGELPAGADVAVLLLDVAAYERVLSRVGRPAHLPAALSAPVAAGAPVPAVVSPSLAGDARLSVGLDGRPRPVRVAGTVDVLPGLSRPDFVVLPLAAFGFTDRASVLFVAGARADPSAVRAAARAVPGAQADDLEGPGPPGAPDVLVRSAQRRALDRSAWGDGITLAFTLAVVAALVAVLLAVALARAVDAPARAGALWLLHTLGLNRGQARRLLLAESAPLLLTALLAGTALGVLLPPLLSPALGLDAFAAGVPPAVGLDAGATGLLAVAVLLTATPARTG